jgi:glycerol-3-phosphate dehydrogenase (NAD(P)+)
VKFLVAGAGSWGTAFAHVLLERGHEVVLGCHHASDADAINETGRNPRFMGVVDLRGASAVPLADAPADVDVAVVAVPSRAFASVVEALPGEAPVLSLTKGLDPASGERLSTRVPSRRGVAVLSGPNMAEEIAIGMPTAAVIASEDGYLAGQLQHAINSTVFRAYVNPDVVGVELCAAAKNVIALAAGGVDGLDIGDNAKASLVTRGLAEMARLGEAAGARTETFAGLAGMGDLIVTCWSRHGRNRKAGELIAQGRTADDAVAEIGQTVEGITTAPVLQELSHRLGVELPITEGVCSVLAGRSINELLSTLMGRQPTEE